jgi:hypothetical protein
MFDRSDGMENELPGDDRETLVAPQLLHGYGNS